MIQGVEVLNQYKVISCGVDMLIMGIIFVILGLIALIIGLWLMIARKDVSGIVPVLFAVAIMLPVGIFSGITRYFTRTIHTEYQVTISKSVSMTEFDNKYEVLKKDGKIYTIKEK